MTKYRTMSASFDPTGRYRYRLDREIRVSGLRVTFILLNPSTADAFKDDPTVRRCVAFAWDWMKADTTIVNLFALRATDPKALFLSLDPIGPENDRLIASAAAGSDRVVAAWGNHGKLRGRGDAVLSMLQRFGVRPQCFGLTKELQPRHPLYLPTKARLIPMARRSATPNV